MRQILERTSDAASNDLASIAGDRSDCDHDKALGNLHPGSRRDRPDAAGQ